MIQSGEFQADNLDVGTTENGIELTLTPLDYLIQSGYQVDGIKELHHVDRDTSDTAHIVAKVETYEYPRDHPDLDLVAHKTDVYICDCWAYLSNEWPDLREDNSPKDAGSCTHIQAVSKIKNAKEDDQQQTITGP